MATSNPNSSTRVRRSWEVSPIRQVESQSMFVTSTPVNSEMKAVSFSSQPCNYQYGFDADYTADKHSGYFSGYSAYKDSGFTSCETASGLLLVDESSGAVVVSANNQIAVKQEIKDSTKVNYFERKNASV